MASFFFPGEWCVIWGWTSCSYITFFYEIYFNFVGYWDISTVSVFEVPLEHQSFAEPTLKEHSHLCSYSLLVTVTVMHNVWTWLLLVHLHQWINIPAFIPCIDTYLKNKWMIDTVIIEKGPFCCLLCYCIASASCNNRKT